MNDISDFYGLTDRRILIRIDGYKIEAKILEVTDCGQLAKISFHSFGYCEREIWIKPNEVIAILPKKKTIFDKIRNLFKH